MEMENSYYGFLFRSNTDSTGPLKGFVEYQEPPPSHPKKKCPKPSYLEKPWKNKANLFRILRYITDITKITITEYYVTLRNITVRNTPPLCIMHFDTKQLQ